MGEPGSLHAYSGTALVSAMRASKQAVMGEAESWSFPTPLGHVHRGGCQVLPG